MKKFESMKVVELKDCARKAGIKGYSRMKKQDLIDALVNAAEVKKNLLNEARTNAHLELQSDFDRAVLFWKKLKGLKRMSVDDYTDMVDSWKLLKSLLGVIDEDNATINVTETFSSVANKLAEIYDLEKDFSNSSDEDIKSFIMSTLENFSLSVFAKKLKKENTEIIKMSMDDFEFSDTNIVFDSSKASKFTGDEVKIHKGEMRIVESSEDAISRMLMERGLSSITVFMGKTSSDEEEKKLIDEAKRRVFTEGFTDKFSGKHYMFAFQNPSSCRKANFMFVEANNWDDVKSLWCEITGLKTWNDVLNAFCDENGEVVMAKVLARVSTRGSNSFNTMKIDPEMGEIIKAFNVKYVKDTETKVFKDYKTMKGPGLMEMVRGESRAITDGDGEGLVSYKAAAIIAAALKRISRNELDLFNEEFNRLHCDIHNVKSGSKIEKIIRKIPAVFQIRHGEKKGLLVRWNLEAIDATKDVQVIIPDSVRKFIGGEWSEYPLEICNFLKGKSNWAYLNPQFITALDWENPNALNKLVENWNVYQRESITDIAKAMEFHGMIKSSDDEENQTVASNLVTAMRTNKDLIDDFQILNWRKDQYRKFNDDMSIGRLMVHGQYTYMVFDPAYLLNKWFGLDLPCLASGEFYHNAKETDAALFRSPLIAPYEAKKVQLVNNEEYKYLADTVVFNGFDGAADDMGGGDHDGDTCEIVTGDTPDGRIIIDGVRDMDYVVWEPAQKAKKTPLTIESLINHLVTSATVDRTGIITNYASRAADIANHLKSLVYFAKKMNCENVTLVHPSQFGKGLGCKFNPKTATLQDGTKTFMAKGFVECSLTKQAKAKYSAEIKNGTFSVDNIEPADVEFNDNGIYGTFSFEEIEDKRQYFLGLVEILRILQGREIDGAKTGVYAEGISGEDFIDAVKVKFTPEHLITRQTLLDRDVAMFSQLNSFKSLSPLGRIHDYTKMLTEDITDMLNNGSNKSWTLQSLLTQEEYNTIYTTYNYGNKQGNLVDILRDFKKAYNSKIYNVMKNLSGDDNKISLNAIKEAEIENLYAFASNSGFTPEVVAVAAYLATYTKDSKQSEGLTYGWLLFDEIISVFARGNKKIDLFRLPDYVESVCIKNKIMYVNDKAYRSINAYDAEMVPVQIINGRPYAAVHKIANVVVTESPISIPNKPVYTIGAMGFKYHIAGDNPKDAWKRLVRENNFTVSISMDATGRAVMKIGDKSIAAVMSTDSSDFCLNGKKVKIVNNSQYAPNCPIEETDATIKNLKVMIVE